MKPQRFRVSSGLHVLRLSTFVAHGDHYCDVMRDAKGMPRTRIKVVYGLQSTVFGAWPSHTMLRGTWYLVLEPGTRYLYKEFSRARTRYLQEDVVLARLMITNGCGADGSVGHCTDVYIPPLAIQD
jgi:hypothetical protein